MKSNTPDIRLEVGSIPIGDRALRNVTSVEFTESLKNTARLQVDIGGHDPFSIKWDELTLGTEVKLWMGYANDLSHIFTGDIVQIMPKASANGASLSLEVLDNSYILKKKPEPTMYTSDKFTSLYDIAKFVAQKYDMEIDITPYGKLQKYVLQDDQSIDQYNDTDWQLLGEMADTQKLYLFVRHNKIYMVDKDYLVRHQQERLLFVYRPERVDVEYGTVIPLYTFNPMLDLQGQREKVTVISWTYREGEDPVSEQEATDPNTGGDVYTEIKIRHRKIETIRVKGLVRTKEHAKAWAEAELQRRAERRVVADASCMGVHLVHPGDMHYFRMNEFGDIGLKYSGQYFLEEVTHRINQDGYVMDMKLSRPGLSQ